MAIRELCYRENADGYVCLCWSDEKDEVYIVVSYRSTSTFASAVVPPNRALDAFAHPFAYLPEGVLANAG